MRLTFPFLFAAVACLFLGGCESPRPDYSRQPHGAPASWESGNPMMSGMGTTNR